MRLMAIALAITASAGALAEEGEDACADFSRLAENIMRNRQEGMSMAKMMELTEGETFAQKMVISAYEQRRYHTEQIQQRKVEDFRDGAYLACVKNKK